jgi:hypothetical protein
MQALKDHLLQHGYVFSDGFVRGVGRSGKSLVQGVINCAVYGYLDHLPLHCIRTFRNPGISMYLVGLYRLIRKSQKVTRL